MMSVSLEEIFILDPPSILTPSACIFKCSFVSNDEIRELKESESLSEKNTRLGFQANTLTFSTDFDIFHI